MFPSGAERRLARAWRLAHPRPASPARGTDAEGGAGGTVEMPVEHARTPERSRALLWTAKHVQGLAREGAYGGSRRYGYPVGVLARDVGRGSANDGRNDAHQLTGGWIPAQTGDPPRQSADQSGRGVHER